MNIDTEVRGEALHRALASSGGFALLIVCVPIGPARLEMLARLKAWAGRDEVPELVFVELVSNERIRARLEALALDPARPAGVVLTGLEHHVIGERVLPGLQEIQFVRDLLPGLVPGPLVMIADEGTLRAIQQSMPDFYNWREFEVTVASVGDGAAPAPMVSAAGSEISTKAESESQGACTKLLEKSRGFRIGVPCRAPARMSRVRS